MGNLGDAFEVGLSRGYSHYGPCAYLPERQWALHMRPSPRSDARYRELLESDHRRSGWIVYQPVCSDCKACRPIRIPVARFHPSKSQRRVVRRNADVSVEVGSPEPTEEKLALYNKFVRSRFDDEDKGFTSLESYGEVFGFSPVTTIEMRYRLEGRLVGVGILDALPDVLSSVYFYFDPDEGARSLGTFSAIREVEHARATHRSFVYLGYYIAKCKEMNYKSRFRPCELLHPDGVWRDFTDDDEG